MLETTVVEGRARARAPGTLGPRHRASASRWDAVDGLRAAGYRVLRHLGSGGMGEVYEVEAAGTGERLALKVLAARLAHRPELAARMGDETRALALVRHPNVVSLHAAGTLGDGRPFLAMELLRGRTLAVAAGMAARAAALRPCDAVRSVRALLRALEAVHRAGLVHCDVKPSNVLLCDDGRVKLIDFGAAEWRSRRGGAPAVASTRSVLGTPRYMAPERRAGAPPSVRCDLYGVGLVLADLLQASLQHGFSCLDRPVARSLDAVASRAAAALPAARFASAREMEVALDAAEAAVHEGGLPAAGDGPGLAPCRRETERRCA
jgi:eukaryotic-like serine/threonine-protein kinase